MKFEELPVEKQQCFLRNKRKDHIIVAVVSWILFLAVFIPLLIFKHPIIAAILGLGFLGARINEYRKGAYENFLSNFDFSEKIN